MGDQKDHEEEFEDDSEDEGEFEDGDDDGKEADGSGEEPIDAQVEQPTSANESEPQSPPPPPSVPEIMAEHPEPPKEKVPSPPPPQSRKKRKLPKLMWLALIAVVFACVLVLAIAGLSSANAEQESTRTHTPRPAAEVPATLAPVREATEAATSQPQETSTTVIYQITQVNVLGTRETIVPNDFSHYVDLVRRAELTGTTQSLFVRASPGSTESVVSIIVPGDNFVTVKGYAIIDDKMWFKIWHFDSEGQHHVGFAAATDFRTGEQFFTII